MRAWCFVLLMFSRFSGAQEPPFSFPRDVLYGPESEVLANLEAHP